MPWITGRTCSALADDPDVRGLTLDAATALVATLNFEATWTVGTRSGAMWADGAIEVRCRWLDAAGQPVAGAGSLQITPIELISNDWAVPGLARITYGDETAAADSAGWATERLVMPPRGRVSVLVSGVTAPVGATQIAIDYWRRLTEVV